MSDFDKSGFRSVISDWAAGRIKQVPAAPHSKIGEFADRLALPEKYMGAEISEEKAARSARQAWLEAWQPYANFLGHYPERAKGKTKAGRSSDLRQGLFNNGRNKRALFPKSHLPGLLLWLWSKQDKEVIEFFKEAGLPVGKFQLALAAYEAEAIGSLHVPAVSNSRKPTAFFSDDLRFEDEIRTLAEFCKYATGDWRYNPKIRRDESILAKYNKLPGFYVLASYSPEKFSEIMWGAVNTLARTIDDPEMLTREEALSILSFVYRLEGVLDNTLSNKLSILMTRLAAIITGERPIDPVPDSNLVRRRYVTPRFKDYFYLRNGKGFFEEEAFDQILKNHIEALGILNQTDSKMQSNPSGFWDRKANTLSSLAHILIHSKSFYEKDSGTVKLYQSIVNDMKQITSDRRHGYLQEMYHDLSYAYTMGCDEYDVLNDVKYKLKDTPAAIGELVRFLEMGEAAIDGSFKNSVAGTWFSAQTYLTQKNLIKSNIMVVTPKLREQLVEFMGGRKMASRTEAQLEFASSIAFYSAD